MSALFPVVTLQMGERQTKCRFVRGGRREEGLVMETSHD